MGVSVRTDAAASWHGIGHAVGALLLNGFGKDPASNPEEWIAFQLAVAAGVQCCIKNAVKPGHLTIGAVQ